MSTAFVRQLGAESGVQLNPLRDNSEIPALDNSDQVFGVMMRATRGRIDKPFTVNSGNVFKKLGKGEPIRLSELNEAWVLVVEALNNGAQQAVVQRLSTEDAKIKYLVAKVDEVTSKIVYSAEDDVPSEGLFFALKHLDCFNDGISVEYNAESVEGEEGVDAPNDRITLNLRDSDGDLLHSFYGSLNPSAKDDYGNTIYLPDVISQQTDAIELLVGSVHEVESDDDGYGYDANGFPKWNKSDVLICFDEGGTGYSAQDYMRCRRLLQHTPLNYGYISSGGSRAPALLAQLAQLAFETNRQFRYDIPGDLDPEAAIAFAKQLNLGASETAHLIHAYWSPLSSNDPTGVNGKGFYGTATLNIAYACARNAQTNSKGFAPKNYPIAGREFQIRRNGIVQTHIPDSPELSALAKAKINPAIYQTYTGGGRYVWYDSLTSALVESSLKKLIAVAEMSTHIDEAVTRYAKDALQKPMSVAVKQTRDFVRTLFEDAQTSGWLVPSNEPNMNGQGWGFIVQPNEVRPYDRMDIMYWLRYDGTARQIHVTHTLSR